MKKIKEFIEDFITDSWYYLTIILSAILILTLIGSFLFSLLKSY
jgi:hypothetical protein